MLYKDRTDAAHKLTIILLNYKNDDNTIIIALPRGGVLLGDILSRELNLPLDIIIPRKLGAPDNPELAIGAIAQKSIELNDILIKELNISKRYISEIIKKEIKESQRREKLYRKNTSPISVEGKTVLLVDDGIATGYTIMASIKALRLLKAFKIIVCVPIAPFSTIKKLEHIADEIKALNITADFFAINQFYEYFPQIEDNQVITILKK